MASYRLILGSAAVSLLLLSGSAIAGDFHYFCNVVPLDSNLVKQEGKEWGTGRWPNDYPDPGAGYCAEGFGLPVVLGPPLPDKPMVNDPQYPFGCCTLLNCRNVPI